MKQNVMSRLQRILASSMAARVGDTCVVSTKVHMQDMAKPQEVIAVFESDAGKTFYHRQVTQEIIHMDIFHSPGVVDPKLVARALITGLSGFRPQSQWNPYEYAPAVTTLLDLYFPYIDIQTAGGGGRLDGRLCYGQEEGVRKAHLTHVHLTALNTPEMVSAIFTMVASTEAAIQKAGLELRKVRKVKMSPGGGLCDISDYRASTDSLLKHLPRANDEASFYRKEALARQAAREVGSASESLRILEALEKGMRTGDLANLKSESGKSPDEIRRGLVNSRLARFNGHKYFITHEGELALDFLRRHSQEIESYLRRLLWSLPAKNVPLGQSKGKTLEAGQSRGRPLAMSKRQGEYAAELALPETIIRAGLRSCDESSQEGVRRRLSFDPADLQFSYVKMKTQAPIILLIDASASMAGRRIAAAKELARHLVLTSKDKVSVVVFQDSDVTTVCDFTRSLRNLEKGLRAVHAMGLTPLAKGLEKALELSGRSLKKPLVLCLTDGIPTVPSRTLSPIDDAISAAKEMARKGIRLGCIGLEPNRNFLRQMVAAAKGTLYVVNELDASSLAAIAKKERA